MNLQQLRFVQEAARRNLNLTETAKALHTSQPGISKAILEFEEELGIDIFARHGKRLRRITEPGLEALKAIDIILREVANLRRIGEQYSKQDAGTLSIATTHTQARYFLPQPVAELRRLFPKVQVVLHQGMPDQVARLLLEDVAEVGLATEALAEHEGLVSLPCYEWQHMMVVPATHPLAGAERPSLEQLAAEPLVLYHPAMAGRSRIDAAFARAGTGAAGRARRHRLRRHQDLCSPGAGRGRGGRGGGARRPARRRPGGAAGGAPVRPQHHQGGLQAWRLPAAVRVRVRRAAVTAPEHLADPARAGRRRLGLRPVIPHDPPLPPRLLT
jgi:DNA-binding transcriptional LysR family regulator